MWLDEMLQGCCKWGWNYEKEFVVEWTSKDLLLNLHITQILTINKISIDGIKSIF